MEYAVYIYLYTVLSSISTAIGLLLCIATLITVLGLIVAVILKEGLTPVSKVWGFIGSQKWAFVVLLSLVFLIPSKRDVYTIIGGAAALSSGEWVLGSEEAQKIPDNVLKAINKFLEDVAEAEE